MSENNGLVDALRRALAEKEENIEMLKQMNQTYKTQLALKEREIDTLKEMLQASTPELE